MGWGVSVCKGERVFLSLAYVFVKRIKEPHFIYGIHGFSFLSEALMSLLINVPDYLQKCHITASCFRIISCYRCKTRKSSYECNESQLFYE